MKLVRFGKPQQECPGIITRDGEIADVSSFTDDFTPAFFEENGLETLKAWFEVHGDSLPTYPLSTRLGPPICQPGKIICIGRNYKDHAQEMKGEAPEEPLIFSKATTALSGPNDPIQLPRHSTKTDWEVELAFVVGTKAKYINQEEAEDSIAGYTIMNDISERSFQKEHCGQWVKGKSHDSFAPLGPYLATPDEIDDVQQLELYLDVNSERMQTGNTRDMIFSVTYLLSYLSRFMTFLPGDIISTGTPSGVGAGRNPQVFLRPGDVVELGVQGLGTQRQEVIEFL